MDVIIIQPPIVQLNTAYPSGAYLSAFFRKQGCNVKWFDLNIALFHKIFSREGLTKLFELSQSAALKKARDALSKNDEATWSNIMAYLSMSPLWCRWIDSIVHILQDGTDISTREICHRFVFSPDVPRGSRMNRWLENLDHELSTDDARFLASLAIADLGDYITAVFDPQFSLVRYAESITVSETSFAQIERSIDSPVLTVFYEEVLQELSHEIPSGSNPLICISIPFAGTFAAALYTGRFMKKLTAGKAFISAGGGFINTELRECNEAALGRYFDSLSYDRGYGSYLDYMSRTGLSINEPVYKMRLFTEEGISEPKENDEAIMKQEDELTSSIIPDFSDIDFRLYPRMIDDINPMQRMWSDGAWVKAYLAHGCYWHKCAFCDTTLDYVHSYKMTKINELFEGLNRQCREKGVRGIHFVDEAMPPSAIKQFAALNSKQDVPLTFWGNVRFERIYTRDAAELFAFGGLAGVSGGIEIATGSGLDEINKGTDLDSIVSACCAFKEAGILVHAYMIFGYWKETPQDLINSMETLRQFYQAGLLDSSFWHKFTLTRHSRVYDEYKKGLHKELHPLEIKDAGLFAKNALHFEGEEKSEKYSYGLNAALQSWMHGEKLHTPVNRWFDFKTPQPTVPANLIEKSIARYEKERDRQFASPMKKGQSPYWLAGKVLLSGNRLVWTYKGELCEEKLPQGISREEGAEFIRILTERTCDIQDCRLELTALFRGRGLCIC